MVRLFRAIFRAITRAFGAFRAYQGPGDHYSIGSDNYYDHIT